MLVTSNDFKPLLHWHGIAVKDQPSKIKEKKKEWLDRVAANEDPVGLQSGLTLMKLSWRSSVDITDTGIGRTMKETASDMQAIFAKYTQEEQEVALQKLQERKKGSST